GMMNPYSTTAAPATTGQAGSYPQADTSQGVGDARVKAPEKASSLVSSSPPARAGATQDVWMYANSFSPDTVMIAPGPTVRWINYGYHNHSVASQGGQWDSGPVARGSEFSLTFTKSGTYRYYCRYHQREMMGTVVVE